MRKYTYNLKFTKGKKTFVIKSEPTGWLEYEDFKVLLLDGVEQGGRFVESWRTPVRRKK